MVRVQIIFQNDNQIKALIEVITTENPVYEIVIDLDSRSILSCTAPDNKYKFYNSKVLYYILRLIDEEEPIPDSFMLGFY